MHFYQIVVNMRTTLKHENLGLHKHIEICFYWIMEILKFTFEYEATNSKNTTKKEVWKSKNIPYPPNEIKLENWIKVL